MSRAAFRSALRGEEAGLAVGIAWVPSTVLRALSSAPDAEEPSESLEVVAGALELDFAFVSADELWATDALQRLERADVATVWSVSGVLGRVGEQVGWSEALRMSAAEPGALASVLAEALHDALSAARIGVVAGADAVLVADELAGASGLMLSPDFVLDALAPCYRQIASELLGRDVPALFHSDGDIRALMPALSRAGFSAVHAGGMSGDALSASIATARSCGLKVIGGIEAASLAEGARHAGERAAAIAASGGLLLCDDGGFTSAEEVAAYATAVDAARDTYGLLREEPGSV